MHNPENFHPHGILHRLLQNATDDAVDDDTASETELTDGNDSQILKGTLRVYGSFFVFMLILFSYLRRKFPRVYSLRTWVDDLKTPLAKDQFGYITWLWKVFLVTDSEMMDECGMDALCYARVLEFGLKLSLVGILNAVWLIPVYYTAEESAETDYITDKVVSISTSHLPSGSPRFIATVVGAYVVFGYAMYGILKEFQWFIMFRNQFLSKKLPRNYSVYVRNIPSEYCTNSRFLKFFQQSSSGAVLEARLAIKAPNLKKQVAKREKVVAALEHKINVEEVRGVTPMKRSITGPSVSAIDTLFTELQDLNKNISGRIDRIERQNSPLEMGLESHNVLLDTVLESEVPLKFEFGDAENTPESSTTAELGENTLRSECEFDEIGTSARRNSNKPAGLIGSIVSGASRGAKNASVSVKSVTSSLPTESVVNLASGAKGLATSAISNVADSLFQEDGDPYNAGFVTFKTLRAAQAAKQLIQYSEPFAMEVLEAPQPEGMYDVSDLLPMKTISLELTKQISNFV